MNHATIVSLLKAVGDRPIAFHTVYAKISGGVSSGIFLSQAFYWSLRTDDPDGWFYKETKEFEEETTLTRHEQDTARRKLKSIRVLEEKRAGDHAILHYRVNFEVLAEAIAAFRQWPLTESGSGHCRIPAVAIDGIQQSVPDVSIKTEITTQITAQITAQSEGQTLETENQKQCKHCGELGPHACKGGSGTKGTQSPWQRAAEKKRLKEELQIQNLRDRVEAARPEIPSRVRHSSEEEEYKGEFAPNMPLLKPPQ